MRCVRPLLTPSAHADALASRAVARCRSAGIRSATTADVAARWIEDGKTSLLDWDALTWSLGCTGRPSSRAARVAMTSFAFMFDDVPDPVWKTSIGNWAS